MQSDVTAHKKAIEQDAETVAEEEMSLLGKAIKDVMKAPGLLTEEENNLPEKERAVQDTLLSDD